MPNVLITGANRGIGLALAESFVAKGYKVFAAVRDPSKMPPTATGITAVKLDASSLTDAKEAIETLKSEHGVTSLDLVVANAGANPNPDRMAKVTPQDLEETFRINVTAPLLLFQAVLPLLTQQTGRFVIISTYWAILGRDFPQNEGVGIYGLSKAAANFLMRKLAAEHPEHVIYNIHPGWLKTAMGTQAAQWSGMDDAPMTLDVAIPQIVTLLEDSAEKPEKYRGLFYRYDGEVLPW